MDSEDESLRVLAAVIIRMKKSTKKKRKHRLGFSRFTEKERNMVYHI